MELHVGAWRLVIDAHCCDRRCQRYGQPQAQNVPKDKLRILNSQLNPLETIGLSASARLGIFCSFFSIRMTW